MILLVQTTPNQGYGAEAVLSHLLRGLPEHARSLVVLASPPTSPLGDLWRSLGGRVVDLPLTHDSIRQSLTAAWRLASRLRAEGFRPHLVFSWSLRATDAALLLGQRLRAPVAGQILDHPEASHEGPLRRRLFRWEANRLKAVVGGSEAVRSELERCFGPSPTWRALRSGLVDAVATRLPRPAGEGDAIRLGFVGMHNAWKGWPVVAAAAEKLETLLAPGTPMLEWHLFGGPLPEFAAEVGSLGGKLRRQRLVLRGHQPTEKIFAEIDLLVHASTRFDPYPTVLLEAARAGLPAIASNLGGGPEIVQDGVTGWVITPDAENLTAAVLQAAASPRHLPILGQAARTRFETDFRVERMASDYLALWRELGE